MFEWIAIGVLVLLVATLRVSIASLHDRIDKLIEDQERFDTNTIGTIDRLAARTDSLEDFRNKVRGAFTIIK